MKLFRSATPFLSHQNVRSAFRISTDAAPPSSAESSHRVAHDVDRRVSISPILEKWIDDGNQVYKRYLQGMVKKLRQIKRFAHVLEEMETGFGEQPSTSGIESPAFAETQAISSGPCEGQQALSHVNTMGGAAMVDVSSKEDSKRVAVASCRVLLGQKAFNLVEANQMAKGDVLNVAKIAGVSGAKQASNLIPLCHNIGLSHIRVDLTLNSKDSSVEIEGKRQLQGKLGWKWKP